jgi:hypothetical protein
LEVYVALGFNRSLPGVVGALCETDPTKGLFFWPKPVLEKLVTMKFAGCAAGEAGLKDKQLRLVGYLFESAYDAPIPPADNASGSFGFEACLGKTGD